VVSHIWRDETAPDVGQPFICGRLDLRDPPLLRILISGEIHRFFSHQQNIFAIHAENLILHTVSSLQMDDARLKKRVKKIAESVKNVRYEDLLALLESQIKPFCEAKGLSYDHRHSTGSHHAFTVGSMTFNLVKPSGTPHLKRWYVEDFLEAMEHINLYE
jgi:hypothetical protein